mmetsp:Transcript_520/g.1217  ORF Transcript_520/g.1217 Transcript_520/m.1217 type:complete len:248 (+) Transcript_520:254-997(+)
MDPSFVHSWQVILHSTTLPADWKSRKILTMLVLFCSSSSTTPTGLGCRWYASVFGMGLLGGIDTRDWNVGCPTIIGSYHSATSHGYRICGTGRYGVGLGHSIGCHHFQKCASCPSHGPGNASSQYRTLWNGVHDGVPMSGLHNRILHHRISGGGDLQRDLVERLCVLFLDESVWDQHGRFHWVGHAMDLWCCHCHLHVDDWYARDLLLCHCPTRGSGSGLALYLASLFAHQCGHVDNLCLERLGVCG